MLAQYKSSATTIVFHHHYPPVITLSQRINIRRCIFVSPFTHIYLQEIERLKWPNNLLRSFYLDFMKQKKYLLVLTTLLTN